jgi:hypothetical protein
MAATIRPVSYYYVTVRAELGDAYGLLADLARRGVQLLGFAAVPFGSNLKQFTFFPDDPNLFAAEARAAQLSLDGPHHAILVTADALDSLVGIHEQLFMAGIDVYATSGATASGDACGYVLYVREDQFEGACGALGCDSPELRAANEWLDPREIVLGPSESSGEGGRRRPGRSRHARHEHAREDALERMHAVEVSRERFEHPNELPLDGIAADIATESQLHHRRER